MTEVANPINTFAQQMMTSVAGPLYTMPEVQSTHYAVRSAINRGQDNMPQSSTTPWNPETQKAIVNDITETIWHSLYERVAANEILTEVVPLAEADPNSNEISWYTVIFDPQLMDEVAELSLGREIGFQTTARTARLRTYKVGYTFSNDILRRPGGAKQVIDLIVHISNIQLDTAVAVALDALLKAEDIYRQKLVEMYQVNPRSLREVLEDEVGFFDILHHDEGVRLTQDHLTHVMSVQQGGAYRYLLLTEDIAQQMRRVPSESEYYRAGPPAITNRNFQTPMDPAATVPTYPGFGDAKTILLKTNYTTRIVPQGGMGILQQIVQIGEFYLMKHQDNSNSDKDSRSNNVKIYDGHGDCYHMIDFMKAVDETHVFDENGNPRDIDDAMFADGAIVKGAIVDVIWDSQGRARYTHGQIPRDYLPHNHGSQFASALAKVLQARSIGIEQYKALAALISDVKIRAATPFVAKALERSQPGPVLGIVPVSGELIITPSNGSKQGVSFDELSAAEQVVVSNFVSSIMDFFPRNAFLLQGNAPMWSLDQSPAASVWENMLIPYYPPVLVTGKGSSQSEALSRLGISLAEHKSILKLVVDAWATVAGNPEKYAALFQEFGTPGVLVNDKELQAKLAAELKKRQNKFNDQQKAAYGKLIQIYELLKQNKADDSFSFTTLRQTPGLDISEMPDLRFVDPNFPLVPLDREEVRQEPAPVPEPVSSAFHVNQALKHHIRAAQSDSTDSYLRKAPTGLIGQIYNRGVHHQAKLQQILGAKFTIPINAEESFDVETRDFIPYARRTGTALGFLAVLFEGEFICRQSWERWANEGLPMPVAILLARPTIDVLTATLVACRGGRDAGALYYKPSAERSGSHVRGQNQVQVQCEFAGVIMKPESVRVMHNALVLSVIRGHSTKFFNYESFKNGPGSWMQNQSLLAFIVPLSIDCNQMISLSGSFEHPGVHNYRDMRYHHGAGSFVGSDRANALYNFKKIAAQRRRNTDLQAGDYNVNVLCFPGQTWYFNGATQTFDIHTPGNGHFHDTDTFGAALVRTRKRYYYPPRPTSV